MKYIIISIVLLGVLIFLISCKAKKAIVVPAEVGEPTMMLSKSSCFGKCKVYKVKFYEDKSVSYEGIDNVDRIGVFKASIKDTDYQTLVGLFESANFSGLENEYLTSVRDKQKTTLSYSKKSVVYQKRAASEELKAITNGIDEMIEKIAWAKE